MKPVNFWNLIVQHQIVIPTIQRDYAQGRVGEEQLRKSFLEALKSALSGGPQLKLTMDFVYGVNDASRFVPLDGQQRLTTLWLLHWYLAYKAGILPAEKNVLQRFSYETRLSSCQFCEDLCTLQPQDAASKLSLREWIKQQTWYYHHYEQNPTVRAMLNMICGTRIMDKAGDIPDGIDEVFGEVDASSFWTKLVTTDSISFYRLNIEASDSDELYVKMNARGRQLTAFENFKAELVEHVKQIKGEVEATDFASRMDVDWTDIFWSKRLKNSKIGADEDITVDEAYFAFIRRYAYNYGMRCGKDESLLKQLTADYMSFEPYASIFDEACLDRFCQMMQHIPKQSFEVELPWGHFDFIPQYTDGEVTAIKKNERLFFYALCLYFEEGGYDEASFAAWTRVAWNMYENREGDLRDGIRLYDSFSGHTHDVLHFLTHHVAAWPSNEVQMFEEQQKAMHMANWRDEILQAEQHAFFKGAIRFLFTDKNGHTDWTDFEVKFRHARQFFNRGGVTDAYARDSKLLRRYIVFLKEDWGMVFDNEPASWRARLLNPKFAFQNDSLLKTDDVLTYDYAHFESEHQNVQKRYAKEFLVHHDIFSIAEHGCWPDWGKNYCYHPDELHFNLTLHPYNAKASWKYYVIHPRTELLLSDKLPITFADPNQEKCRPYKLLYGKDVMFAYKGHCFKWLAQVQSGEADVYLMYAKWESELDRPGYVQGRSDLENFYCFRINPYVNYPKIEDAIQKFEAELNRMIAEYESETPREH